MSSDTIIAILKTKHSDSNTYQYRVIYTNAIEDIYYDIKTGNHDYPNPRLEELYKRFYDSPVFYDVRELNDYIHDLEEQYGPTEYGVRSLDHSDIYFPHFTEEDIRAYDEWVEKTIQEHRDKEEVEWKRKRIRATKHLLGGTQVNISYIQCWFLDENGNEIRGQLEGIHQLVIPREGADFLPNDWDK